MPGTPSTADIRKFLVESLNDEELSTLCFDYFRDVYNDFASGMIKGQKIQLLIERCERRGVFSNLLAAIQRARPEQYEKQFPQSPHLEAPPAFSKPQRDPKRVFISHAHEDAKFAHRLADDLRQRSWRVWIAPESILPGEKWAEAIDRGLSECGAFVIALTPDAVRSRWVRDETFVAIELEKKGQVRFVPLDVAPCDVPHLWSAYQRIPFQNDYGRGLTELLDTLKLERHAQKTVQPIALRPPTQLEDTGRSPIIPKPQRLLSDRLSSLKLALGAAAGVLLLIVFAVIAWRTNAPGPTVTSIVKPTSLISTQLPASHPLPEPTILAPISTSPVMSTSVQPPLTTSRVDRVILDNGETISFAADWLEYLDRDNVLSAGLPLTRRGKVLFSDLKSAEVYTSATTFSDITMTVALLNGTQIADTLRSGGRLKGLTPEGALTVPLADIRHIDFGLTAETPITVNMTAIVNSSGEEIQTPTDLLEAAFFMTSQAGPFTYVKNGLSPTPGIVMPFSKLRSLKVDPITGTLGYTLTYSLLDGSSVAGMLDNVGSPSIRGLSNLGAFNLPVHDIRQINFHRIHDALSPPSKLATVTLRDGKTISFAAEWLEYIDGNMVNSLSAGLPLTRRGEVLFSDLKSAEVYTSATAYDERYVTFDNITITVDLLNGTQLTDTLRSGGRLKGLTPEGALAIPLANIRHIDFGSTAEAPITVNMTAIVNSSGEEIQIPTDLLEAAFVGSSMAGSYTNIKDGLSAAPGVVMPFNMLRSLKIDHITDTIDYTLTFSLLDGSTVVGRLDNVGSPSIRGLSNLGAFNLSAYEIRQINFHRIRDALSPLSNLATVTLRDGSAYNIPAVWLAYSRYDWIAALPTSKNGNLYFKLMKSLEFQVGPDSSNITATIQLLKDQTLVDKVAEYGDDHLLGITTNGQLMDARLGDVKRVDFSAAPFLLPTITRGTITMRPWLATKSGFEIKTPVNSVKISFGEGGQAGYFVNYTNDLPLSLGTSMPFSKIKSFKVGNYDSGQGYAITLYLLDGQTLETHLKSTAQNISINGLSDIGPFNLAINYITSVDFNR